MYAEPSTKLPTKCQGQLKFGCRKVPSKLSIGRRYTLTLLSNLLATISSRCSTYKERQINALTLLAFHVSKSVNQIAQFIYDQTDLVNKVPVNGRLQVRSQKVFSRIKNILPTTTINIKLLNINLYRLLQISAIVRLNTFNSNPHVSRTSLMSGFMASSSVV